MQNHSICCQCQRAGNCKPRCMTQAQPHLSACLELTPYSHRLSMRLTSVQDIFLYFYLLFHNRFAYPCCSFSSKNHPDISLSYKSITIQNLLWQYFAVAGGFIFKECSVNKRGDRGHDSRFDFTA